MRLNGLEFLLASKVYKFQHIWSEKPAIYTYTELRRRDSYAKISVIQNIEKCYSEIWGEGDHHVNSSHPFLITECLMLCRRWFLRSRFWNRSKAAEDPRYYGSFMIWASYFQTGFFYFISLFIWISLHI